MFQVSSFKLQEQGTTLVEIVVVIFIIAIFSSILVSNLPQILRQFALSESVYKLSQDFRKVQDLGLSGVLITQSEGGEPDQIQAKGYGIYFDLTEDTQYIIYADRGDSPDSQYDQTPQMCQEDVNPQADCILEVVDVTEENSDLYIKEIKNISSRFNNVSINFAPPNPSIVINNLSINKKQVGIILGLRSDSSLSRAVWVNVSGLIRIE